MKLNESIFTSKFKKKKNFVRQGNVLVRKLNSVLKVSLFIRLTFKGNAKEFSLVTHLVVEGR